MPAEAAQGVIEYLKANPEAAKAAWQQAQAMLKTPGLAHAMLNMPVGACMGAVDVP
jgi:Tfp pilus assembly protein FimV